MHLEIVSIAPVIRGDERGASGQSFTKILFTRVPGGFTTSVPSNQKSFCFFLLSIKSSYLLNLGDYAVIVSGNYAVPCSLATRRRGDDAALDGCQALRLVKRAPDFRIDFISMRCNNVFAARPNLIAF